MASFRWFMMATAWPGLAMTACQSSPSPPTAMILSEPAMDQPPAPWTVTIADGSGNRWRFSAVAADVGVVYLPVTPGESSSGVYSGGTPWTQALTSTETSSLWAQVRAMEADVEHHIAQRRMGTVALVVTTTAGVSQTFISGGVEGAAVLWCRELSPL